MKIIPPSQPPGRPRVSGGAGFAHIGLLMLSLGIAGLNAPSATAAKPDENTRRAVGQLASDHWLVRSRAQRWLLKQKSSALSPLLPTLIHTENAEQKARVIRICLQRTLSHLEFVAGPRPLIGINFFPRHLTLTVKKKIVRLNAAQVVSVLPGFPAGRVLQSGDIILALDSHPFPHGANEYTFPLMLGAYPPGATVNLLVMRDRKLWVFPIQLVGVPPSPTAMISLMQQRDAVAEKFITQHWPWGHPLILAAKPNRIKK